MTSAALPASWCETSLSTVVDVLDRFRVPLNAEERAKRSGAVPYYGATGQVGWIDGYLFDEELILLGEDGAPFLDPARPKAYMIRGKSWVNNHAHVLRAKPGVLNAFLMYQLNQIDFRSFVSGTTRMKLPQAPMCSIGLKIAPEPEQHRIVDEIEKQFTRLDAAVAALERVRANLRRYRAAVLAAACGGRLVPTEAELARAEGRDYEPADVLLKRILQERRQRWEADHLAKMKPGGKASKPGASSVGYREPAEPDVDVLPQLPAGWAWATFGQVICEGPQNGLYKPAAAYGDGVPILRIDDYQEDFLRQRDELRRVSVTANEAKTYGLNPDDLVINRVNSPSHLGKCVVVPAAVCPAVFESNMMRMVMVGGVAPKWISVYTRSKEGKTRLTARAKWAVNQASINQTDVCLTPLPVPPFAEQQRIVTEVESRLSIVHGLETIVRHSLKRADRLRQSIFRRAFEGELVPQDPADEPASLLLERIRAELATPAERSRSVRGRRRKAAPASRSLFEVTT